jgi:hypothetical protein
MLALTDRAALRIKLFSCRDRRKAILCVFAAFLKSERTVPFSIISALDILNFLQKKTREHDKVERT